jgi:hypothetical protein
MSNTKTLGEKLPEECARVRELIGIYREHCGASGGIAIAMMESAIKEADQAMITGDLPRMIAAYQTLQDFSD